MSVCQEKPDYNLISQYHSGPYEPKGGPVLNLKVIRVTEDESGIVSRIPLVPKKKKGGASLRAKMSSKISEDEDLEQPSTTDGLAGEMQAHVALYQNSKFQRNKVNGYHLLMEEIKKANGRVLRMKTGAKLEDQTDTSHIVDSAKWAMQHADEIEEDALGMMNDDFHIQAAKNLRGGVPAHVESDDVDDDVSASDGTRSHKSGRQNVAKKKTRAASVIEIPLEKKLELTLGTGHGHEQFYQPSPTRPEDDAQRDNKPKFSWRRNVQEQQVASERLYRGQGCFPRKSEELEAAKEDALSEPEMTSNNIADNAEEARKVVRGLSTRWMGHRTNRTRLDQELRGQLDVTEFNWARGMKLKSQSFGKSYETGGAHTGKEAMLKDMIRMNQTAMHEDRRGRRENASRNPWFGTILEEFQTKKARAHARSVAYGNLQNFIYGLYYIIVINGVKLDKGLFFQVLDGQFTSDEYEHCKPVLNVVELACKEVGCDSEELQNWMKKKNINPPSALVERVVKERKKREARKKGAAKWGKARAKAKNIAMFAAPKRQKSIESEDADTVQSGTDASASAAGSSVRTVPTETIRPLAAAIATPPTDPAQQEAFKANLKREKRMTSPPRLAAPVTRTGHTKIT